MANSNSFDWSNVVGAGIGALGNVIGGLSSNALSSQQMKEMAKYTAKLNYKYWKKQMLNQPTFYRTGLENANYNPMLALGGMQSGNSNWSQMANPTTPDLSNIGSSTISNALSVRQQQNNNAMTNAQVQNYNADTVLKNNQAFTELYTQLEKLNHADLMQAQKVLADKDVEWYDKKQAREDLKVANDIERTANDFKVGMTQAIASQIAASAQSTNAMSNAKDVEYRYEIGKKANENTAKANEIAEKNLPPKWASVVGGILGTSVGAGLGVYGAINGGQKGKNFKTSVPY